jgi:hypothetical protein
MSGGDRGSGKSEDYEDVRQPLHIIPHVVLEIIVVLWSGSICFVEV